MAQIPLDMLHLPGLHPGNVFWTSKGRMPMLDARNSKSRPWVVVRRELDTLMIVPRTTRGERRDVSKGIESYPLGRCLPDHGHFLPAAYQDFERAVLEGMERDRTIKKRCAELLPAQELAQIKNAIWESFFGTRARVGGLQ
jgi:hypothetical protein